MFENYTGVDAIFWHGDQKFVDYTPAADVPAGRIINLGSGMIGIATYFMPALVKNAICVQGTFKVKKASATDFTVGGKVEWDNSGKLAVASGTFRIGWAELTSEDDADFVCVDINKAAGYANS